MSDKSDSSLARHDSQAKSGDKVKPVELVDTPEELLHLQCEYYRRINALLPQAAADNLGPRIKNVSEGAFMPSGGYADIATLAGFLNLSQHAVSEQLKVTKHEQLGFGRTVFYAVAQWFFAPRKPNK